MGCAPASGEEAGITEVSQLVPVHVVISVVLPLLATAVPDAPPVVSTLVAGVCPPPLLAVTVAVWLVDPAAALLL